MLAVQNVTMRFGARILFDDATCNFLPGRRYAITGPNGAGKSTLMKILTGEIEPAKGSFTRPKKFGVLRQDQFAFDAFRAIDTVVMGNAPLWKAMNRLCGFAATARPGRDRGNPTASRRPAPAQGLRCPAIRAVRRRRLGV